MRRRRGPAAAGGWRAWRSGETELGGQRQVGTREGLMLWCVVIRCFSAPQCLTCFSFLSFRAAAPNYHPPPTAPHRHAVRTGCCADQLTVRLDVWVAVFFPVRSEKGGRGESERGRGGGLFVAIDMDKVEVEKLRVMPDATTGWAGWMDLLKQHPVRLDVGP